MKTLHLVTEGVVYHPLPTCTPALELENVVRRVPKPIESLGKSRSDSHANRQDKTKNLNRFCNSKAATQSDIRYVICGWIMYQLGFLDLAKISNPLVTDRCLEVT